MQRSDFTVKLETDKDQVSQILLEEKLRKREMWPVWQLRYRKKRENYVNILNNENRQLHDQIKRLEQRHHPVSRAIPAKENAWSVVVKVLDGLAKNAFGSIVATTTTTVIFSEHTVDTLFPHLRRTDGNMREMMSTLGEKFVNEKIVMRGSTHFEWDSGYCRIARIQHQSDMITPVLRVLGALENVSRVFDKALIIPDFRCRQKTKLNS
ncbi:hypothetical protein PHMEG_00028000 [Phytophthora megakarya]|uniref:Bzip transcription factor n=1 Tax=Phytophthora megakarya TaxID=4795 RepID=A0A225V6K1_9STRA|nr:hypothetical protein PHMEG_00028000 [Phytophthora megakarya]